MQLGLILPWWAPLLLSVTMEQGQHWTDYVNAFSTLAAGVSAIAVAVFAGVQIWRENSRDKVRQGIANARVSAEAYKLRRELRAWVKHAPRLEQVGTVGVVLWWKEKTTTFEWLDGRLAAMLGLVSEASSSVGTAVKAAYDSFYKMTEETAERFLPWSNS